MKLKGGENTSSLRKFAVAWTLMWAFAYIFTAVFAPYVGGEDVTTNFVTFLGLGAWMIISLALYSNKSPCVNVSITRSEIIGRIFLFWLGLIEVFGGITSWTGLALWNVPFPNKELFQVSMAFADLIAAVFMFYLAIDDGKT